MAEEFKIESTPDLLGEAWRLLPDDEVKILWESLGDSQDRLTVILPQAEGKTAILAVDTRDSG